MKVRNNMRKIVGCVLLFAMLMTGACGKADTVSKPTPVESVENLENSTSDEIADTTETVEPIVNGENNAPTQTETEKTVDKSVYMDSTKDIETRIDALLAQMTKEEKYAQMVQPEQNGITLAEIKKYGVGSILSGGGSAPSTGNTAEDWRKHINSMKSAALDTRLSIPLLYGVDAVHGHNNVYGAVIYPHNIALGAANDAMLVERIGEAVAREVRATGIQWTFAPTLGNPQNELWGRTYECFGENTDIVAALGAAFVRGFQGNPDSDEYLSNNHVLATAKHYIGEGYTLRGTNQGDVSMDEAAFDKLLHEKLLDPYKAAIDAGVRTVMVSYNSVNGLKCHGNKYLITDVLKGELNFTGLVVSDYNGIQQIQGNTYKEQVMNGVNAGTDLFMEPYSWKEFIKCLGELVDEGKVSEERVDDAVRRILRVKFEAGLFEEVIASDNENSLMTEFGTDEHREIAREAVRKSLVLLKDKNNTIEKLSKAKNILVVGSKADDLGSQCGGWTISWQGSTGNITEGTTILAGLRQQAGEGVTINYSVDGTVPAGTEAIILVMGEQPYAESSGDRSNSNLTVSNDDKIVINTLFEGIKNSKIPVVGIVVAGRPITIAEYVDKLDSIVMAWLPGSEGEGISDVLLGDYEFSGVLPYTWPWYASDIENKFVDEAAVLFKPGTGLDKAGNPLREGGTVKIGKKPVKSEQEIASIEGGSINLASVGYVLEAENYTENSYLVTTGNANNISYVDGYTGQWANAKWNVYVPKAGKYRLHFIISSPKNGDGVALYYQTPAIADDGDANRTVLHIKKTGSNIEYGDFTLDVELICGIYEFKLMNTVNNGIDLRLDRIEFEYLD